MENIREFMDELSNEIMQMLPGDLAKDLSITPHTVTKMNDQVLYGLTFKRQEENAAPTIYVNEEFKNHQEGKPLGMISGQMIQLYLDSLMTHPEMIPQDLSFENLQGNLTFRVVEVKRNHRYLSEIPYMSLGNGLAAVCDIKVQESEDGYWRTTVTRAFMEDHHYDKNELFQAAFEQAPRIDPPMLVSLENQLFGFQGDNYLETGRISEEDKVPMYVLSNESGMLGASVLFYPGVQEKIAEAMGEGYTVLPSSVHEVIIVPDSLSPGPMELAELVRNANRDALDPKDVLSDNVMHYDKEAKELTSSVQSISLSNKVAEARC